MIRSRASSGGWPVPVFVPRSLCPLLAAEGAPMMIVMVSERRKRRIFNEPGHAHELTFSCYRRFPFLKAERTCLWLAEALRVARTEWDFALCGYGFMPEHVHLIVCPRSRVYNVSSILRAIQEPVGRRSARFL